jgi:4-amino-4-deoxy-L-arabinose transferase-like glycosyltransferase
MTSLLKLLNSSHSIAHWIVFVGFISIALLLRTIGFQGYSDSDPHTYTVYANDLAHGTLQFPRVGDHGPPKGPQNGLARPGLYGPVAILVKTFGLSELTIAVYPLLASVVTLLLAYVLARSLYGPLAGLLGIGLLAVLPYDVQQASILQPDPLAAFWANVGVVLTYFGLTRDRVYHSTAFTFLAGVSFGISWVCKESVVYLVPCVGILILCLRREATFRTRVRWLVSVGIGSMAVLVAETLSYRAITGDPLFHFHVMKDYCDFNVWCFDQSSTVFGWESGQYAKVLFKRLVVYGPKEIFNSFNALPVFAAIALAWGIVFRHGKYAMPGIWFVTLVLMYNFASTSLEVYRPLPILERYMYPLILPSVLLVAGFLADHLEYEPDSAVRRERAFLAWTLVTVFCVQNATEMRYVLGSRPEASARAVADKLHKTDIVYTDYRTAYNLVFFRTGTLLPSTETRPYEHVDSEAMEAEAYVLIDKQRTALLNKAYYYRPPPFVDSPPQTWRKVWANEHAILFQIPATVN